MGPLVRGISALDPHSPSFTTAHLGTFPNRNYDRIALLRAMGCLQHVSDYPMSKSFQCLRAARHF